MRLQLHKGFPFSAAAEVVPYLAKLGISHLYSSPILTAAPGSMHGYDVIDPTSINPELGGEAGLRDLVARLRQAGLGLIVDIVPNHMAVGSGGNAWWQDVLRSGPASRYAAYFDINWAPADPSLRGKVLAPFLGRSYGEALAAGEIRLATGQDGTPLIRYFDNAFPIDPKDFPEITAFGIEAYDPGSTEGLARLHRLLERQNYRLAWWGTAGDEINWRRFFDINGLAGLRIELPEVFEATHAKLFQLYAEGLFDGVRVDHVDGLSDPPGYCRRLRGRLRELEPQRPPHAPKGPAYLVVEKILGAGEKLPANWDVDGTSGYDFMNSVSLLQHDGEAAPVLGSLWASISGRPAAFESEEVLARRQILKRGFDAQLEATAAALHRLARLDPITRDLTAASIRRALVALLAGFPVYRGYGAGERRSASDDAAFARALSAAKHDNPRALHPVLDMLDHWLGGDTNDAPGRDLRRVAGTRFQQLSAPVAAKAVEDTAFYRYGRLLSRNDVGFEAGRLGTCPSRFHDDCQARREQFPAAMLATATHDHKRGEDVRARLAVLSEFPEEWEETVRRWMQRNARHRAGGESIAPSPGDEVMLYQMIVGAWPLALDPSDAAGCREFTERLSAWQLKAIREEKLETDWTTPNTSYEDTSRRFLFAVMEDQTGFLGEASSFAHRIGPAGAVNGLAQTLLKLTVPGVPDIYQGTEFWDLSLVDPDNRRPVNFSTRMSALQDWLAPPELAATWRDGRVKQAMIARALDLRRRWPSLFARGSYEPLELRGPRADNAIAFLRRDRKAATLVLAPRLPGCLLPDGDSIVIPRHAWSGTVVQLPPATSLRLHDVFRDRWVELEEQAGVEHLIADFPVALFGPD